MSIPDTARDAIHDALLASIGWLPYLKEYGVLHIDGAQNAYYVYDRDLKSLTLPDGYTWGTFIPSGYLYNNYEGWERAAIEFLTDPDGYIDNTFDIDVQSDWANANIDNNAPKLIPLWLHNVAFSLNLCNAYDYIWPHITFNFRSMPKLHAPWNEETYRVVLTDIDDPKWAAWPSAEWLTVPADDHFPRCTFCNQLHERPTISADGSVV